MIVSYILKRVHLQQLKGKQSSKLQVCERGTMIRKGYLFPQKWDVKGVGSEASRYKQYFFEYPLDKGLTER